MLADFCTLYPVLENGELMLDVKSKSKIGLERIQAPIDGQLQQIRRNMDELLRCELGMINEIIFHLFSRSGKMIRPTLLLLVAEKEKVRQDELLSMGAVIEIIHTASLVHDDSIDKASYRRGVQTLNSKWNHKTSVIIGDYMLAQAFRELTRNGNREILAEMTAACQNLAMGEMRQMSMEGDLSATEEDYLVYIHEKTASLFKATCAVGSLLNGGTHRDSLSRFGTLAGMIFQVTDDLLDYVGCPGNIGKSTGMDIRERKITLPLIHALSRMDKSAFKEIKDIFSLQEIGQAEAGRVAALVAESGGIEYAWARVNQMAREAIGYLDELQNPALTRKLQGLVEVIIERDH